MASETSQMAATPRRRWARRLRFEEQHILYVAVVGICIGFALATPAFFTGRNLQIILVQAVPVIVVAAAVTFVIVSAEIDLSVGSIYAISGTLAAFLMQAGWNWTLAAGAAMAVGLAVGLLNGGLTVWGRIPSFLVTLGTLGIVRGVDLMLSGTRAISIRDAGFVGFFAGDVYGVSMAIWWTLLVAGGLAVVLRSTVFGQRVYAVGGDHEASRLAGINVGRVRFTNFIISGGAAALAGLIVAGRIRTGQPTIGQGLELDVITAVILGGTNLFGGRGRVMGSIVGALAITAIGNGLILLGYSANVQTIAKGVLLVLTVLLAAKAER